MLNRHRHGLRIFTYYVGEMLVCSTAFLGAYWLRQATSPVWGQPLVGLRRYLLLWPLMLLLWSVFLWGFNTYAAFRSRNLIRQAFLLAVVNILGTFSLFALLQILKQYTVNRSFVALMGVAAFLLLLATRMLANVFLSHYTQKGYDRRYVLIGGTGEEAVALARSLEGVSGAVFQVHGFASEDAAEVGRTLDRWSVLATFDQIPSLAAGQPLDVVYLLPRSGPLERHRPLVEQCEAMGIDVHLKLSVFEHMLSRLTVHEVGETPYLQFSTAPRNVVQLTMKRAVDVISACLMFLVLSPLLLLVVVLVKLTSRGPAVFWQERAGRGGRLFTLYKFRTMYDGADKERFALEAKNEMSGPVFKIKDDPRVTRLGWWLRRTSIDELPQLWNILKGDMSLVGPRPLPVYEVEKFEPWQRRRMMMRPGITCLWQVMGRNRVTDFAEWMKLDLEYVDRWSLWLDFKILLKTIPAVLGGRGAY